MYKIYGDDIIVIINKFTTVGLPTRSYIFRLSQKFLVYDFFLSFSLSSAFSAYSVYAKLQKWHNCAIFGCIHTNIETYYLINLCKKVKSLSIVLKCINTKLLFLCQKHFLKFCANKYSEVKSRDIFNTTHK